MRVSIGSSVCGTMRSTTLSSVAPRMPGLAIASFTLHAPRSTANVRVAISVFPQEYPPACGRAGFPAVLWRELPVPHAGDRRANRRIHRAAFIVGLLARDLAVGLDAIRAARLGGQDRL